MKKALLAVAIFGGSISTAMAADGCKFLLCMGAPNPMGISECAPTVKEVMRDLSRGKGLPTCKLSDGRDSKSEGSFVTYRRADLTPDCPSGYRQGRNNVLYHNGVKPANLNRRVRVNGGVMSELVDDDDRGFLFLGDRYKARACVKGNSNGSIPAYSYSKRVGGEIERINVPRQEWYDNTMLMTPDGAKYEFTMHIDNAPYSKHRF